MTQQAIDLQKIQVLSSSYQGWFNFKASIVAGNIVGALILIATMFYQNVLDMYGAYLGYAIATGAALYFIWEMRKAHDEHISFVNGLMLRIEKGEKLESIEELRKMQGKSAKTEKLKTDQHEHSLNMQAKNQTAQDEEREFQLEMLKIQISKDIFSSVLTVIIGILGALFAVILSLAVALSDLVPFESLMPIIGALIIGIVAFAIFYWAIFGKYLNNKIQQLKKKYAPTA